MASTALVTGGNRGIGLEVCRGLAQQGHRVLLASRVAAEGERAAAELRAAGHEVRARELDVTDRASILALADALSREPPLDVLVNNAGIALDGFDPEIVRRTLAVNFEGPMQLTDALAPRLAEGARVVMVSSGVGALEGLPPALRARFDPPRDRDEIIRAVGEFERAVRAGREVEEGWPRSAYRVSKIALNALTRLLADELRERGVMVNAVCPGWVRTRMGGPQASRAPAEGAAGIVWAATLPEGGPSGAFFRDGHPIPW